MDYDDIDRALRQYAYVKKDEKSKYRNYWFGHLYKARLGMWAKSVFWCFVI